MPGPDVRQVGAAIVRACRRLDARGILAGAEGNLSARVAGGRVVVTPSGVTKAELAVRDLVTVSVRGAGRAGRAGGGGGRRRVTPSSELPLHLAIYAARPDVGAVVHAHPPAATGFAVARRALPHRALAELAGVIGPVPLVPYRAPGSAALASAAARAARGADALLLANHGVVTVGRDVAAATRLMESVEQAARIVAVATILGNVTRLGASAVHELDRARTGTPGRARKSARKRNP